MFLCGCGTSENLSSEVLQGSSSERTEDSSSSLLIHSSSNSESSDESGLQSSEWSSNREPESSEFTVSSNGALSSETPSSSSIIIESSVEQKYSSSEVLRGSSAEPEDTQKEYRSMTVLDWNIHYENTNTQGIARIINEVDPDVVGLCEFTTSTESLVSDLANVSNRNFQLQPGRPTSKGYGTDIFYDANKWEALEGGVESVSCSGTQGGDRAANWVVLKDRESDMVFITGGIHLSACKGGCDETKECELGKAYDYFEAMKEKYDAPVVWMGDLNKNIDSEIIQKLFEGLIGDRTVFAVEDIAQTVGGTFHTGTSAIDYILAEPGTFEWVSGGRTEHGVTGEFLEGADHYPIYSHLRWEVP
ncbi:MAG: hypothetical protein OCD01_08575 [Fibrobacterales bacterium]